MPNAQDVMRGEFHAAIREMEPGIFRAQYRGELNPDDPDARELPDYHVGTSVQDLMIWVEQMARSMGFSSVVWDSLPQ